MWLEYFIVVNGVHFSCEVSNVFFIKCRVALLAGSGRGLSEVRAGVEWSLTQFRTSINIIRRLFQRPAPRPASFIAYYTLSTGKTKYYFFFWGCPFKTLFLKIWDQDPDTSEPLLYTLIYSYSYCTAAIYSYYQPERPLDV